MFTPLQGFCMILGFWFASFACIILWSRQTVTKESFLVANRSIGTALGAISVATAWIWAPALFVASQKAYQQGLPGLFWFTVPNALSLVLFSFLAVKMRSVFPDGITLPQFIRQRFDRKNQVLYMLTIFVVQIYAVVIQLTAALLLLNLVTGIAKPLLAVLLGIIILSLSLLKGIRSSIVSDVVKATMITVVGAILIPWAVYKSGGGSSILAGLGGSKGTFTNMFDPTVAWTFGIPISVSLLSGVVIDQQQWQRAFSMKKAGVRSAFIIGGALFALVPVILGILGYVGASQGIVPSDPQLVGFAVIQQYLPRFAVGIFTLMILSGLVAAGSSALAAASSLGTVDLYPLFATRTTDALQVRASRVTMCIITAVGVAIALIPNIQILYLQLLAGAFRAALIVPTILALFWLKLSGRATFAGILVGMAVGVPLFIYGSLAKVALISSFGSMIPIIITLCFCIIGTYAGELFRADSRTNP